MDDLAIFQSATSVLGKGRSVALVTVISTTGSTPGKVGYRMLVFPDGDGTAGTVGGGMTEARMIEEATGMLGRPASRLFRFDLGGTPDDENGICGGSVEFLIESFDPSALPLFQGLAEAVDCDDGSLLVSIIAPDGLPRKLHIRNAGQIEGACRGLSREVAAAVERAATSREAAARLSVGGMDVFIERLALRPTLVLFGAGHVSCHIARFANSVHFRIVVCDDRAEYANHERFPEADEIVVEDFSRIFERIRIDEHSYLVIVTRGHKHDRIVLEQAVRTDARYIGMIGSRRKTLTLLDELRATGVSGGLLSRVYSPVGVSIGAVTAEEIALSIVCELVKVRRLGDEPPIGHMTLLWSGGAS